jgi:hypothetical protein
MPNATKRGNIAKNEMWIAMDLSDEAQYLMDNGDAPIGICLAESVGWSYPKLWHRSHDWVNVSREEHRIRGMNSYRCSRCAQTHYVDSSD